MMTMTPAEQIYQYAEQHIDSVLKEPRSFIRYPFIDPGSVYDGNVWDWDTYWSVYSLLPLAERFRGGALRDAILCHARGNVLNFLDWQLEDGYIPMMIEVGQWKEPYLNLQHKNGHLMNMHKPFLCQQIRLISRYQGDWSWITGHWEQIDRYFVCYWKYYFHENTGLFVWRDDIMIGMDNDPASFGRPGFSTANIFLNSFMVMELEAAQEFYHKVGEEAAERKEEELVSHAKEREQCVQREREELIRSIETRMYDPRDGFYYSVDVDIKTRKYDWFHQGLGVFWKCLPIRIAVWSGFLPMLAGFATDEEAEHLVSWYHNQAAFGSDYGITTLDRREKMFRIEATNNPSDWLGPIWVVANYCVFAGMKRYGYQKEAMELADKTLRLLAEDLTSSECLHEYYDPDSGKPVMNGGFLNWNLLALNMAEECHDLVDSRKGVS
ncbi:MAG: trehalase family glycosidase [Firmicutes bacterium]|nr:trehalase family glycosidase [Bacillota bacterium]